MRRFFTLFRFELVKVLARKKALLFLLALNVVPLLASVIALLVYMKLKGFGIGGMEFSVLTEMVRGLFTAHIVLFGWISPFFLSLVIGDSFSGDIGRGYMKTLLLTPVERWQVVVSKALAVLMFLLVAVAFGGFFLQMDLWVARAVTDSPTLIWDLKPASTALIETSAALQLFFIAFLANLALIGYFTLFSMFSESPLLMAFVSMIVLMTMQTYVMMVPYLTKIDSRYGDVASWCFTRHLSKLSEVSTVHGILEKRINLLSPEVWQPMLASFEWAALFFLAAILIFRKKQILS